MWLPSGLYWPPTRQSSRCGAGGATVVVLGRLYAGRLLGLLDLVGFNGRDLETSVFPICAFQGAQLFVQQMGGEVFLPHSHSCCGPCHSLHVCGKKAALSLAVSAQWRQQKRLPYVSCAF